MAVPILYCFELSRLNGWLHQISNPFKVTELESSYILFGLVVFFICAMITVEIDGVKCGQPECASSLNIALINKSSSKSHTVIKVNSCTKGILLTDITLISM